MVPFDIDYESSGRKQRASISFESLFWFFVVTAGATILGELIYDKYVSPYLADLPNIPDLSSDDPSVVSQQTPMPAQSMPSSNVVNLGTIRRK